MVARFVFLGPKAPVNPTREDYYGNNEDIIFLGSLYKLGPDGTAMFQHIDDKFIGEGYDILEKYGVSADVLKDLLIGIEEDVMEAGKDFDYYTYTKYFINSFRFIEV